MEMKYSIAFILVKLFVSKSLLAPEQCDIAKLYEHLEVVVEGALVLGSAPLHLDLADCSLPGRTLWSVVETSSPLTSVNIIPKFQNCEEHIWQEGHKWQTTSWKVKAHKLTNTGYQT